MSGSWGPTDPSLWLTRPLGHWEAQLMVSWPPGVPGPSRCTINNVTMLRYIVIHSFHTLYYTTGLDPMSWTLTSGRPD